MGWQAEMKDGYWLGKDHPGVYQGERQALNEDYTHSGFDRGHLNPNGHHAGNSAECGGLFPGVLEAVGSGLIAAESQRLVSTSGMMSRSHSLHLHTSKGVFAFKVLHYSLMTLDE